MDAARRRPGSQAVGVGEVLLKLDHTNPTHSFKDRVVAVAAAKAAELGTRRSRAPRPATSATRSRREPPPADALGRPLPDTVEPEKLLATAVYGGEMYAVRGNYDDCSPARSSSSPARSTGPS